MFQPLKPTRHRHQPLTNLQPKPRLQQDQVKVKTKDSSDLSLNPLVIEQMTFFLKDVLTESLIANPHTVDLPSTSGTAQVKRKATLWTMTFRSQKGNSQTQLNPQELKSPRGKPNLATLAVAPADSEEEGTMEFGIDEKVIDDLLGDDSISEPEKEQAQINQIGLTSSPNSWFVRKKLDRWWLTIWQTLSERC